MSNPNNPICLNIFILLHRVDAQICRGIAPNSIAGLLATSTLVYD